MINGYAKHLPALMLRLHSDDTLYHDRYPPRGEKKDPHQDVIIRIDLADVRTNTANFFFVIHFYLQQLHRRKSFSL